MNLRSTRRITYSTPPSAADMEALNEIAAIDAGDADAEGSARRAALVASLGTVTQLRATVATMAALQMYRFQSMRREIGGWVEAETGKTWAQAVDAPESFALVRIALKWPVAIASLTKLETREIGIMEEDAATPWAEIELPDAWRTPAGYLGEAPIELIDALDAAALAVNPGLYGPAFAGSGDELKKSGGISVE